MQIASHWVYSIKEINKLGKGCRVDGEMGMLTAFSESAANLA